MEGARRRRRATRERARPAAHPVPRRRHARQPDRPEARGRDHRPDRRCSARSTTSTGTRSRRSSSRPLAARGDDPATAVLGADAAGIARAADYFSRDVHPGRHQRAVSQAERKQEPLLRLPATIATARRSATSRRRSCERCARASRRRHGRAVSAHRTGYSSVRTRRFATSTARRRIAWRLLRGSGAGAFERIAGEVVKPCCWSSARADAADERLIAASTSRAHAARPAEGAAACERPLSHRAARRSSSNPDARSRFVADAGDRPLLGEFARQLRRAFRLATTRGSCASFWELPTIAVGWERLQSTRRQRRRAYGGREHVLCWEDGDGATGVASQPVAQSWPRRALWGERGVAVAQMGDFPRRSTRASCSTTTRRVIVPTIRVDLPAHLGVLLIGRVRERASGRSTSKLKRHQRDAGQGAVRRRPLAQGRRGGRTAAGAVVG